MKHTLPYLVEVFLLIGLVSCGGSSSRSKRETVAAPSGVTAISSDSGEATLDWLPVTGATSHNIYWSTTAGVTAATGTPILGATPPHTETGLINGNIHYFVVTAVKGTAESVESTEVSVMPQAPPTGVTTTPGSAEVTLDWTGAPGATSYNIYWSTSSGVTRTTGTLIAGVTAPYLQTGLVNGTGYFYIVTAVNSVGGGAESSASSEVSATPDTIGMLDPTFNGQGFVAHHNAAGGMQDDFGRGITVDTSGRILVTGDSFAGTNSDMVIWRYDDTGTLDSTFNGQGWVIHGNAGGGGGYDTGLGIAVNAAGNILVTGNTDAGADVDMVVWCYRDDGTLDPGFGAGGIVTHHNAAGGDGSETGVGIAVDATGNILVAGHSFNGLGDLDRVIWRLTPGGALDVTFNARGWVVHDGAAGGAGNDQAWGIALDPTGRILAVGNSFNGTDQDLVIWRYDSTGILDAAFGGQGWVVHDDAAGGRGDDEGRGVAIDASGRIVAAGHNWGGFNGNDMAIWRFNADGTLDTSFGGQGWISHHSAAGGGGSDFGRSMTMDAQGRIVVGGFSDNSSPNWDAVIWRYNPDGILDASFDGRGWVVHDNAAGGGSTDQGLAIGLDTIGRIVATGWSIRLGAPNNSDMVIWRYR